MLNKSDDIRFIQYSVGTRCETKFQVQIVNYEGGTAPLFWSGLLD